jgi:hypothetical protein
MNNAQPQDPGADAAERRETAEAPPLGQPRNSYSPAVLIMLVLFMIFGNGGGMDEPFTARSQLGEYNAASSTYFRQTQGRFLVAISSMAAQ